MGDLGLEMNRGENRGIQLGFSLHRNWIRLGASPRVCEMYGRLCLWSFDVDDWNTRKDPHSALVHFRQSALLTT